MLRLKKLLEFPGVRACGACFPDRSTIAFTRDSTLSISVLEGIWRSANDTFKLLHLHRLPAHDLRWMFQDQAIFCMSAPDGVVLGILTERNLSQSDQNLIKQYLTESLTVAS